MDVNKAPVDIIAKVTDTFEALIAPKNANQCKAITIPAIQKPPIVFQVNLSDSLRYKTHKKISDVAINMRYQTKGIASIEMSAPSTAVNPQIKTIK